MKIDTCVLEIRHPNDDQPDCLGQISEILKLDYHYVFGAPNSLECDPYWCDLEVDISAIENLSNKKI